MGKNKEKKDIYESLGDNERKIQLKIKKYNFKHQYNISYKYIRKKNIKKS